MKKIIYSIFIATVVLFSACNDEDIPDANFDMMEASLLKATVGDEQVSLNWEALEGAKPTGYYLSWTASSLAIKGGDKIIEGDVKTATITDLVNGETYTFSVQPIYGNKGRGGKISVKVKPVSTRIAATNFLAAAGDKKIRLKWSKPEVDNLTEYKLYVSSLENPIVISKDMESYEVTGLTNDTEYNFSLVCVYPNGTSDAVQAKATPGQVEAIVVASTTLTLNESSIFSYNDMYFTMGTIQSVSWDFGDGTTSTENQPQHAFSTTGSYTVKATVIYTDGTSETGAIIITVAGYAWLTTEIKMGDLSGYVKVSNVVFSPDGKTAYIPTSSPNGHLFAMDVVSGKAKWVSQIATVTYGGGAVVDENGIIYQCGTDSKVYAINPTDGSKKWTCDVDGVIGAFPALSASGILYCATNSGTLFAINTSSGSVAWSKPIDGTSSAVAVDASENAYVGTNSAVYKFNSSGVQQWKTSATLKVTERGAFAINGTTLYATQKAGAGLAAIDMSNGNIKWTYANTGGDSYFPIVGTDGTIYFNEKGSTAKKVYAINANGSLKWEKDLKAALTYCGLVLANNGKIYCATQSKTGSTYTVYGLNTANGNVDFTYDSEQQIMAGATVGPDKRLYIGTIGANNIGSLLAIPIDASPETSSWSVRGGNIYGTSRK